MDEDCTFRRFDCREGAHHIFGSGRSRIERRNCHVFVFAANTVGGWKLRTKIDDQRHVSRQLNQARTAADVKFGGDQIGYAFALRYVRCANHE